METIPMIRAGLLFALLFWGSSAFSMPFTSVITGADMSGMAVTATFADGSTETAIWATTSTNGAIPFGEGYAGAATGTGWSLAQQGFTLGNFTGGPGGSPLGVWTFNSAAGALAIASVEINAIIAGIVFDVKEAVFTPGSGVGREFLADTSSTVPSSYSYGSLISSPDLYGTLSMSWDNGFAAGSTLRFMADTDKIPEPPTVLLMTLGLLGLVFGAKKKMA
ncbi:MAG: PEP-CTERM sorting domain-containing protein [Gammaproteobacteria bacterium]|nr:PEP-CTERM sorting domain-containing protein [Gammaproteobacteria bacterium]